MLDDSPADNESASYTTIRDAVRHAENRALDMADGSIADSRWSEKRGRLRRVDGTEREMARGIRADEKAAWGRMSTTRAAGSASQAGRSAGEMAVKGAMGVSREKVVDYYYVSTTFVL
jgi:hypothetical protein